MILHLLFLTYFLLWPTVGKSCVLYPADNRLFSLRSIEQRMRRRNDLSLLLTAIHDPARRGYKTT